MTRTICSRCHYPENACLCDSIQQLTLKHELIVLQDPAEVGHAKNSVHLLRLVVPTTQVVVGETPADFAQLREYLQQLTKPVYLVYPSDSSLDAAHVEWPEEVVLLFVDGTWRKSYKLLQLNPWLLEFPSVQLSVAQSSNYTIRKSKRSDSLSTIEAAAMVLQKVDATIDTTPMTQALAAMVNRQLQKMPTDVRARYSK